VAADAAYLGDQIAQRRMQTGVRWIAGLPRSEKTVA
jgi:hypothetical protein